MDTSLNPAVKPASVQLHAALRNDYVEILVDFALRIAIEGLLKKGVIVDAVIPERHKAFKAVDASDVFDHYFKLKFTKSKKEVVFWGQTTCYKGNETGAAEANKTYEIRETLMEALTLRRHLLTEGVDFRVIHFTFGPSEYTYGWFQGAKSSSFDWSMYSSDILSKYDVFTDLTSLLSGCKSEFEAYERLEQCISSSENGLKAFIDPFVDKLEDWISNLPNRNQIADKQSSLLNHEYDNFQSSMEGIFKSSQKGGENIKGKVLDAIDTGISEDPHLTATLNRIYSGNGFIGKALEVLKDWTLWSNKILSGIDDNETLESTLDYLWNLSDGDFYITRRLLVRLFSSDDVHYPADLNIKGVTEHTLYVIKYPPQQNAEIVEYLRKKYYEASIRDTLTLKKILFATQAKHIIVKALKHDTGNGTNLKPSFYYIEEALKGEYSFVSFEEANLPLPVGFQINFAGEATVQAYGNLKVIVNREKKPVAIIKAKFFRKQEFPRRAKEESYVGLTAKYEYNEPDFSLRYNIPFIMFIDMDTKLTPPEFAIVRLMTTGWFPIFSIKELKAFLASLK